MRGVWSAIGLAAVLTTVLFGCAFLAPPLWVSDPSTHQVYGGPRFIKAVGASVKSQADAALQAKTAVAAQAQSLLKDICVRRIQELAQSDKTGAAPEYRAAVSSETKFTRTDLIRVDPKSYRRSAGKYYAFAYMDKDELGRAVTDDYDREADEFKSFYSQARLAYEHTDPQVFAQNFKNATLSFSRLEDIARIIMISGGAYEPHRSNVEYFQDLIAQKNEFKSELQFILVFAGPDSERGQKKVKETFLELLHKAGFNGSDCSNCPCEGPFEYRFVVESKEQCGREVLGQNCSLGVVVRVERCSTATTIFQFFCSAQGSHPEDPEQALNILYNRFRPETLGELFRENMQAHFPY